MITYLTEADVTDLLTMDDAVRVLDDAIRQQGEGDATNRPRQRVNVGTTTLHVLPAAVPAAGSLGLKAYTTGRNGAKFWLLLFGEAGELRAIMEADRLGQVRTGAASGVATRHLARDDARTVAMIGSGFQARTQLEAVCTVRDVERVLAWSRTRSHLDRFCDEMSERLNVPVTAADSAEAAVREADIVVTMTSAREPVVRGDWVRPGTHLNVAGSNKATHREIDGATVARAVLIVTDDKDQARVESGDLILAVRDGATSWDAVGELGEVLAGAVPGRETPDDVTIFASHGIGLWDVAVAAHVYELARERGVSGGPCWLDS